MTGLVELLAYASGVSACVACIAAIVYICWWAFARKGRRATSRSLDARLRFEAIWGIVLALPLGLGLMALAASFSAQPLAAAGLVLVAVAFFAIPVAALRGFRLPPVVRWVPAGVAFSIGTPLAALTFYVVVPVLWYIAGCMVAVRFALAARAAEPAKSTVALPVRERHSTAAGGN